MSYTVIARRYRPQTFEEVIGQSAIATTLQNAIKENKVSHAYIFAGERGVGKTSMARIMAKALNCKSGPTVKPCGKCDSCKSITEGNDPDVIEIDAASQTKVDDVRVLQEGVGYVPLRSKFKIYIMDEAHQLSRSAFNALLKTIEEPPPHVKFIFATTEPHKLPETIISRCQRFNFRRISPQDIYLHLEKICAKEKVTSDKNTLALIAQMAQGSMRDAESILDQLISFGGGKVSSSDIESLLGAVSLNEIFNLIDAIEAKDLSKIIAIIDDAFNQGKDIAVFFDQMIEHLWRLILLKVTPKDSSIVLREIIQDKERYQAQANLFTTDRLLEYIKHLSETRWRLKETTNTRVLIELALLNIANIGVETSGGKGKSVSVKTAKNNPVPGNPVPKEKPPATSLSDKSHFDTAPVRGESEPIAHPRLGRDSAVAPQAEISEPEGTATELHKTADISEIGGMWSQIMEEIKKNNHKVHAYLRDARFVRADNQEFVIGFPPQCNFHRRMFDDTKNKKVVEEYVQKITGHNLSVTMTMTENAKTSIETQRANEQEPPDTDTPPEGRGSPRGDRFIMRDKTPQEGGKNSLVNDLLKNPLIKRVQEEFEARVIKVDE